MIQRLVTPDTDAVVDYLGPVLALVLRGTPAQFEIEAGGGHDIEGHIPVVGVLPDRHCNLEAELPAAGEGVADVFESGHLHLNVLDLGGERIHREPLSSGNGK